MHGYSAGPASFKLEMLCKLPYPFCNLLRGKGPQVGSALFFKTLFFCQSAI